MSRSIVLKSGLDRCINKDNNHILLLVVQQTFISHPPYDDFLNIFMQCNISHTLSYIKMQ